MGVSNTQIATHSNVESKRIHTGFSATYATTATKCVTKERLQMIEFLEAKDRSTSSDIYYSSNNAFGTGSNIATLNINNRPAGSDGAIKYTNLYYTTATYEAASIVQCAAYAGSSINAYGTVTVKFNSEYPDISYNLAQYAIFTKQITGVTIGLTELAYTFSVEGLIGSGSTSQSGAGSVSPYGVADGSMIYGLMIADSNGQVIATEYPREYQIGSTIGSLTGSITFSTNTSTIYVYIFVPNLEFYFNAGQSGTYAGFKLKTTTKIKYLESRYDLGTKCVQYQDINHPTLKTFTIYYGVWNNKSSNAKLNNLYVQIKKTTDSTWTTIGTASLPSSLNSTTTGSVTCTLPTTYDPKVQYDFRVTAGDTNSSQKWYYRWGSQSSLSSSGYSWTKYSGSAKTGVCSNEYGLNTHSTYSTLKNYNHSSTILSRGRSAAQAALFCIE